MSLNAVSDSQPWPRWIARSGALAAATGSAFLAWVLVLQLLRSDGLDPGATERLPAWTLRLVVARSLLPAGVVDGGPGTGPAGQPGADGA